MKSLRRLLGSWGSLAVLAFAPSLPPAAAQGPDAARGTVAGRTNDNLISEEFIVGKWSYRSFRSDPDLSKDANSLLFGSGTMALAAAGPGRLSGSLGGEGWELRLTGTISGGDPATLRLQGKGVIGGEEWVYDYLGYAVPGWPNGVDQRPAIVGSIVRTVPHSGGTAKAGYVAQWIAVKQDPADPRSAPRALADRADAAGVERELREAETRWAEAVGTNDPARIGKFFTDDFLFVGAGGILQDRNQHLDDFASGRLKVESVKINEFTVHAYEQFAIASTSAAVKGKLGERDISGDYRFMDTWRSVGGRWLAVARQQTRVSVPAPGPRAAASPEGVQAVRRSLATRLREESIGELRRQAARSFDDDAARPAPQRLALSRAAAVPFRNPPVLDAGDGEVTLEVKYATNTIGGDTVNLRSYGGKLVGPTLKVRAGQTLKVKLVNHLPPEPAGVPHVENGHHEWNTTNLHTHGLHVKPQANPGSAAPAPVESDNVLLEIGPGETQAYAFEVPADHPAGTFWYHAHKHGSTSAHVASGMEGALIVTRDDGDHNLDAIPAVKDAMATVGGVEREKVMVFQQIPYIKATPSSVGTIELRDAGRMFGPGTWNASQRYTTINGQRLPVIEFAPGEIQRWRMIDSGFREGLSLQIIKDPDDAGSGPDHLDFCEIAVDGLATSGRRITSTVELFPGYRSDVLVQAPAVPGTYHLIDAFRRDATLLGEAEPLKFVAKVVVRDAPAVAMTLPTDGEVRSKRLASLPDPAASTPVQHAYYGLSGGFVIGTTDPGPNGAVSGAPYSPTRSRDLQLGLVQRWRIGTRNDSGFVGEPPPPPPRGPAHPFHIHVNPFEIISVKDPDGREQLATGERIWRDTLSMPPGFTIEFLTRYADFAGSFVQHCHILDHEDRGMMEKVTIRGAATPGPGAAPADASLSRAGHDARGPVLPDAGGRPSVTFFVQGPQCPHCVGQVTEMATKLAGRDVRVAVVSAAAEVDLAGFPKLPFALVADPDLRLFKEFGAYDGGPKHATVVRDRSGGVVLKRVGDEPFMDSGAILAALREASPGIVIAANGTDEATDDYLSWAPMPCHIRVKDGTPGGPDLDVTLTNDDPAANPLGGDVRFAEMLAPGQTATLPTLSLKLKQDGTPVKFYMAGIKASRLTPASLANGGRDAVVEVHQGGSSGALLSSAAVMVRVRKNFTTLTETEKTEFLKALAGLRDMETLANDRFEPLVEMHMLAAMGRRQGFDQAHISSGFFSWHRAFLLLLEREMQKTRPHVALPYWLMDEKPGHFTPDYLGNNVDPETGVAQAEVILSPSNPLYQWRIRFDNLGKLVRAPGDHVAISTSAGYASIADLNRAAGGTYRRFEPLEENNPHNLGHDRSGAWMRSCVTSPADPLFWIFHCHHDHLWASWQRTFDRFDTSGARPDTFYPEKAFSKDDPPAMKIRFPLGHHLPDTMWPWDETKGEVIPGEVNSTRPAVRLAKFPKSAVANAWPKDPASPTAKDMIDYLGIDPNRLPHGVSYDDVPWGAQPGPPPGPLAAAAGLARPLELGVFLDRGASEGNRLNAARAMSLLASPPSPESLVTVMKDNDAPPAVKSEALSRLADTAPDEAVKQAVAILSARESTGITSARAMNELIRMHHLGALSDEARASVHAAIEKFAKADDKPAAQAVAVRGLAEMGAEAASPILAGLLEKPEASPIPLRDLLFLGRRYPELYGRIRPHLSSKQGEVTTSALGALSGDQKSYPARVAILLDRDREPAVRRAAARSVMADSPAALETLVRVASDPSEPETLRAEAAAGVRVAVGAHRSELGPDRIAKASTALSSLRVAPTSELGKTVGLTLEVLAEEKK